MLFSASVLVGDSGEEIMDQVTSLRIDSQLSGGDASGFLVPLYNTIYVPYTTCAAIR